MELSIIIVNYKSKGLVRQNLYALENFLSKQDFEVIIVDNNSKDGVNEMISKHKKKNIININFISSKTNNGFASGVNLGLKETKGEFVLIINPDIVVDEAEINKLIEFIKKNPKAGIVGPRLDQPDGVVQQSCFRFPTFWNPFYRRTTLKKLPKGKKILKNFLMLDCDLSHAQKVDWLQGSCILVRRSAIEEVGLIDENYFMYFEDTDWCREFQKNGFEVWYVPQAHMTHYFNRWSAEHKGISAIFSKGTWVHIKSWLYYFYKWQKLGQKSKIKNQNISTT